MKKDLIELDTLDFYLHQINSQRTLSVEEECDLAKKIQKGSKKARDKLVMANLRFVVSVARNYMNQGIPLTDLINEGNLGLLTATKKFNGDKNFKFISYAVWWIRQGILKALAEQSRIVKIPLHTVSAISDITRTQIRLEQKYHRDPNISEIAVELKNKNIKQPEIHSILKIGSRYVSLNQPFGEDKDLNLIDVLVDENQSSTETETFVALNSAKVQDVLKNLKKQEEHVIRLYFGIGVETNYTLEEIAQGLKLTRERVRQIKQKALQRLRPIMKSKKLNELFDS